MQTSAFHFNGLTPDLILNALEALAIRVDSGLIALNSYENRVYQFKDEDGLRYVVKFYRPERWTAEQILEEHQLTEALFRADLSVVSPLRFLGKTLHQYQGYLFAVYPSVGGRQYEVDNLDHLEEVGRLLGRLHQQSQQKRFVCRPLMGIDEYLLQPFELLKATDIIHKSVKSDFLVAVNELVQAVIPLWTANKTASIALHGDCHPGNILWRDEPLLVDFDDARMGPAIQDIWMLLHGEEHEQRLQLDILLEGYTEFVDFDLSSLALIEPLRAMRMVHYLAWLVRRWPDPAFPQHFPWVAESDFWLQQTQALNIQQVALHKPSLTLSPVY